MPDGVAICNTGPLIALAKIGRADLLPKIFSEVLVPTEVANELQANANKIAGVEVLGMRGFRTADPKGPAEPLLNEIDTGESAVIQLGIETPDSELLLDDKKARRIAQSVYRLDVLGTGGLLLRAKRRGLVSEMKPLFEAIRANGYYLSDRIVDGILAAGGES